MANKRWLKIILTELHDAYPEYQWYPDMLINATHSAENLAHRLQNHSKSHKLLSREDNGMFIRQELLERGLGVYDASDDEVNRLIDDSDPWPASYIFADIISRRAQIGWSTHGHSGSYIPSLHLLCFLRLTHIETLLQPSTSTSTLPIPNKPSL